jgi:hypothetical protein
MNSSKPLARIAGVTLALDVVSKDLQRGSHILGERCDEVLEDEGHPSRCPQVLVCDDPNGQVEGKAVPPQEILVDVGKRQLNLKLRVYAAKGGQHRRQDFDPDDLAARHPATPCAARDRFSTCSE